MDNRVLLSDDRKWRLYVQNLVHPPGDDSVLYESAHNEVKPNFVSLKLPPSPSEFIDFLQTLVSTGECPNSFYRTRTDFSPPKFAQRDELVDFSSVSHEKNLSSFVTFSPFVVFQVCFRLGKPLTQYQYLKNI